MKKSTVTGIIIVIIIGAIAFYGGMQYDATKNSTSQNGYGGGIGGGPNSSQMRRNGSGGGRAGMNGGFTAGEILNKDDKSITIKTPDGGSKIIFFSSATEIGTFAKGMVSNLEVGKSVMINGKANSDGSIAAQSIQVRPPMPQAWVTPSKTSP